MQRFVREYLIDFNGSRAAIAVGYKEKTARIMASKLLARPEVQKMLGELSQEKLERLDVSVERILLELSRIAFIDARKLFDKEGNLIPIHELDAPTAAVIAHIDHDDLFQYFGKGQRTKIGTTTKVRMHDKTKALEMLGKYRTLFTERIEHIIPAEGQDLSLLTDEELKEAERCAVEMARLEQLARERTETASGKTEWTQ
jgi:phage terminase small subunit